MKENSQIRRHTNVTIEQENPKSARYTNITIQLMRILKVYELLKYKSKEKES